MPFVSWKISTNKRDTAERDMAGMVETTWGRKKTNTNDTRTSTQGLEHHPLVPRQYRRGGPMIKRFKGCGLVVGGKESILGFQL